MKKILFSTMLLAGMLASCSDEEFGTVNSVDTTDRRTQIDLILNGNAASTRLTPTDESFTYTTKDVLGAVLVDNGVKNTAKTNEEQNYVVDWTISDSHVGNNKWYWDGSKFATEGTTSVGAWLFYTRYNKDMSVNRNGVEYTFPQIQEYASDYEWIANNNVNFIVSPIYRIDGYEGESIQLPVYQGSIHSTVKLNLELPNAVTEVQKIVLTAKDAKGNSVQFPTKGRILNTKMDAAGAVANMLISGGSSFDSQYELHHIYGNTTAEDMKAASLKAFYNFMNSDGKDAEGNTVYMDPEYQVNLAEDDDNNLQAKYTEITQPVGNNTVPFLVLDCVENHNDEAAPGVAVTGGKFTSYMLIPAGIYQSITLYVYTNDGIYKKDVDKRDMTVEEDESASTANDKNLILLRRHTRVNLANITKKASKVEDAAIKIEEGDSRDAQTVAKELGGVVVTKTADLIAAINGSQDAEIKFLVVNQAAQNFGSDAAVPEHTTLINKAVADATEAMINRFKGETVNLIFKNSEMKIKGEETPYDLKNMTFKQGCNLTAGSINVADRIHFEGKTFKVQKGATANFTEGVVDPNIPEEYNESTLENYGTVNFKKNTKITTITNKDGGVVNVEQILSVVNDMKNYESVVVTATGNMTVNDLTNVGRENNVPYNATVVNNNFLTFTGENSKNAGIITNNMKEKKVEVKGTLTNMEGGVINNVEDALFIAQTTGNIYNEMKGNINNAGELYCIIEGSKRGQIMNYGTITAEEGALTYITKNQLEETQSSADLKKDNIDNTNIGRIILKERGSNMSVSTANMQGIIEYTLPENTSKWVPEEGDKFNKLILANTANDKVNNPIDLTALKSVTSEGITKVISVEISGDNYVKFADNQALKELIIDGYVNVLGQKVSTAILRVMNGKLTIPTNNVFGVYSFNDETGNSVLYEQATKTGLYINNHATILVGGRFYTSLPQSITSSNGEFASGAGSEAYIFESPEKENYVPSWEAPKKTTPAEP